MRIAVLSLLRDRLKYTIDCFATLRDLAGCDYDHYILDQDSFDGTKLWLRNHYSEFAWVEYMDRNVGISRGLNILLDRMKAQEQDLGRYDAVVKFDNDCELVHPDTLKVACRLAVDHPNWLISPRILGLNEPPAIQGETSLSGVPVLLPSMIGGIFMASDRGLYDRYRHSDDNPVWGMDDVALCGYVRGNGGEVCYLRDYEAWHHRTTKGQGEDFPEYFDRKMREFQA